MEKMWAELNLQNLWMTMIRSTRARHKHMHTHTLTQTRPLAQTSEYIQPFNWITRFDETSALLSLTRCEQAYVINAARVVDIFFYHIFILVSVSLFFGVFASCFVSFVFSVVHIISLYICAFVSFVDIFFFLSSLKRLAQIQFIE